MSAILLMTKNFFHLQAILSCWMSAELQTLEVRFQIISRKVALKIVKASSEVALSNFCIKSFHKYGFDIKWLIEGIRGLGLERWGRCVLLGVFRDTPLGRLELTLEAEVPSRCDVRPPPRACCCALARPVAKNAARRSALTTM